MTFRKMPMFRDRPPVKDPVEWERIGKLLEERLIAAGGIPDFEPYREYETLAGRFVDLTRALNDSDRIELAEVVQLLMVYAARTGLQ